MMQNQLKLLETALAKRDGPLKSLMKLDVHFRAPKYNDSMNDGRDAEKFFEDFEKMVAATNDGRGATDQDIFQMLGTCLDGSRKEAYILIKKQVRARVEAKELDASLRWSEGYRLVKERLMQFLESEQDRQLRARTNWALFRKRPHENPHQFLTVWEKRKIECENCGIPVEASTAYIDYLQKIDDHMASRLRLEHRMYTRNGEQVLDIARTWEELHALHREFEAAAATGKAFKAARSAALQQVGGLKGDGSGRGAARGRGTQSPESGVCSTLQISKYL